MSPDRRAVLMALKNVIDPEVGLNVVSMGLVYGLELTPEEIRVRFTLTSQGCPLGPTIAGMAQEALDGIAGSRAVRLELVWSPPWDPRMIDGDGRAALGM